MSMLAFFPWLKLNASIRVDGFQLLSYERGQAPAGQGSALQNIVDTVFEPYMARLGQPIRFATVVQIDGKEIISDLTEDERNAIFTWSEMLAACGLSCRKYFGSTIYCNRDNFRVVIQAFANVKEGVAVTTRRRDGSTTNYVPSHSYQVLKPDHIPLNSVIHLDTGLLVALMKARNVSEWERFWESLINFNLANTDNIETTQQVEAVFMIGAFERLLDCHRGQEDDLASKFTQVFTPTSDVAPGDCARLSDPSIIARFKKSTVIRDMWIRDFFRIRGALAHGKTNPKFPQVWTLHSHLLLASYAFPRLLKCSLVREGFYELTESDQFEIDLFEPLASEEHFAPLADPYDLETHPWNQVYKKALDQRSREELIKAWNKLMSQADSDNE